MLNIREVIIFFFVNILIFLSFICSLDNQKVLLKAMGKFNDRLKNFVDFNLYILIQIFLI
jgi:hypothetical protein